MTYVKKLTTDEIAMSLVGECVEESERMLVLEGLHCVMLWLVSISALAVIEHGRRWKLKIARVEDVEYVMNLGRTK